MLNDLLCCLCRPLKSPLLRYSRLPTPDYTLFRTEPCNMVANREQKQEKRSNESCELASRRHNAERGRHLCATTEDSEVRSYCRVCSFMENLRHAFIVLRPSNIAMTATTLRMVRPEDRVTKTSHIDDHMPNASRQGVSKYCGARCMNVTDARFCALLRVLCNHGAFFSGP